MVWLFLTHQPVKKIPAPVFSFFQWAAAMASLARLSFDFFDFCRLGSAFMD
jgi:hypothetical protein